MFIKNSCIVSTLLVFLAISAEQPTGANLRLFDASKAGNTVKIAAALKEGASINVHDDMLWTPLHYAAARGHGAAVRELLAQGADKKARDKVGWTPVTVAKGQDIKKIIRDFREGGVS